MKRLFLMVLLLLILNSLTINAQNRIFNDRHDIKILDLFIGKESLECKKQIPAYVEVINKGDVDDVFTVEVVNFRLGVDEFSPTTLIEKDAIKSIPVNLKFKEEPDGDYEFEILAIFNKEIRRFFKTFEFKCPKTVTRVMPNLNSINVQNKVEVVKKTEVSFTLVFMVILLIVIFLLAIVYIGMVYINRY